MLDRYDRHVAPGAAVVGRAALERIDDAGHALPHEQPGALREVLAEWLTRVERRAS